MKKLVFLFTILLFLACSENESKTLKEMKSDKLLSESFTENELENLAKIVDFFDNHISKVTNEENFEKAYTKFLKQDSIRLVDNNEVYRFDYKKQQELYLTLDTVFFNDFWIKGIGVDNPRSNKEIKYAYFYLNVYNDKGLSKYSKFLSEFSNDNNFIKKYFELIKVTNAYLNPSSIVDLILEHNDFDKNDVKIKLIYSLHYLNLNEKYKHLQ